MTAPASFFIAPCDLTLVDALRNELSCTETLAWVLARRGVTPEAARSLIELDPSHEAAQLHDPMLLGDMAAGVERIRYAIEHDEQIVVHGDYDADGICATTLLTEGLELTGAKHVGAFLPDRFTNGYGLNIDQVERFARNGVRLLIAVDCGITAVEAVAHANELGMDVIICDHHLPGETLPDAILCSTRPSEYPFPELCATAVAGKLLQALGGPSGPSQHELEAIATVADCVPLIGENRTIVQRGLRALRASERPGIRALAEQCGIRVRDIDADAIAFKLAPRINAVGRISSSERGYEMLRADAATAPALAAAVDATNDERRTIERAISAEAIEQIDGWSAQRRQARIYVVHGRGWHEGVVGIVASRLVERYCRPVIVVSDGDPARGSGRSVDGVDIHAALAACDDVLLRWGGHAQAGGLSIDPSRIDELQQRLAAWGDAHIADEYLAPRDRIDAIVPGNELRFELVEEIERLAPFGMGWPRPRLLATSAVVEDMKAVGGDGTHLKCVLRVGEQRVPAIGFGLAPHMSELADGRRVDVALRPSINRFRGAETLQAELDRFYPVPADPTAFALNDGDRVTMAHVLACATGMATPELADAAPDQPPTHEPMLARPGTVDLRHRGIAVEHVTQLIAAGATTLVVVADAMQRCETLATLGAPNRFNTASVTLLTEWHTPSHQHACLQRIASGPRDRGELVLCDHASLAHVIGDQCVFDAIVVFDPPPTIGSRDRLCAAPFATPLHLVFGAAEARCTADLVRATLDVRTTLKSTYRHLRDNGPLETSELEALLINDAGALHTPSAIIHGLQTLLRRGILAQDTQGRLTLGAAEAVDEVRAK